MLNTLIRKLSALMLAAAGAGTVLLLPGTAMAEGPGYGGTADALTVQWRGVSASSAATGDALAIYAVGFRSGSAISLRIGSGAEQTIIADSSGALRALIVKPASPARVGPALGTTSTTGANGSAAVRVAPGASITAVGETPASSLRTLIGAVPPPPAGHGIQDLVPWSVALTALGGLFGATRLTRRVHHPAHHSRHRATGAVAGAHCYGSKR